MAEENEINKSELLLEQLRQKAIQQLDSLLPAPVKKSTFTYAELYEKRTEVQRFLIPELVPAEAVCVLLGEDGIGKTQICSQLCAHIALGYESFLGLKLITQHNRCLIVATEDSKQKFTNAITKIIGALQPSHDPKKILIDFTEGSDFDDFLTLKEEIENCLRLNFYDLIILDALSDLFTLIDGDINSNSHARKLLSFFQYLCNTFGTTIIIIHHAAKSKVVANRKEGKLFIQKNDQQGAGAITQKPRTVLALSNDPKSTSNDGQYYTNYLHVVKANLMGKMYMQNAIKLQFDSSTLLHKHQGLIDIEMLQEQEMQAVAEKSPFSPPTKKSLPSEIPLSQHREIVTTIFSESGVLPRADLITKLTHHYGVGKTKIEQAGGYLSHLLEAGLIEKYQLGSFKKAEKKEGELSKGWEPASDGDDTPF